MPAIVVDSSLVSDHEEEEEEEKEEKEEDGTSSEGEDEDREIPTIVEMVSNWLEWVCAYLENGHTSRDSSM